MPALDVGELAELDLVGQEGGEGELLICSTDRKGMYRRMLVSLRRGRFREAGDSRSTRTGEGERKKKKQLVHKQQTVSSDNRVDGTFLQRRSLTKLKSATVGLSPAIQVLLASSPSKTVSTRLLSSS